MVNFNQKFIGVVNIIPGDGPNCGSAISNHLDINKIAFTGSTQTGRLIQEASAKSNLKRVSLELGGKSPVIVYKVDDAGIKNAAQETANSIFGNQGQSCCASSRVFVHESVHDKYVEELKRIAESKKVGDPFDENTTNGAIISSEQFEKILNYIEKKELQIKRNIIIKTLNAFLKRRPPIEALKSQGIIKG